MEECELSLEGIDDKEIEMVSKTHSFSSRTLIFLTDVAVRGRGKDKGTALVQ